MPRSEGSVCTGLGPPTLRRFFFWDARSQKKKVSGRPRPVYADWRTALVGRGAGFCESS